MARMGTKEKRSPRKAKAVVANAMRPRGRWANTEERAMLEEFKTRARELMCGPGLLRLRKLLEDESTDPLVFLRAMEFVANRTGLPPQLHQQVEVSVGRTLLVAPRWLGWPRLEDGDGPAAPTGDAKPGPN